MESKQRVFIAGGSGFLGRALARAYAEQGVELLVGTRGASAPRDAEGVERVHWDPAREPAPAVVAGCGTVFNLIGENIGASRWSESKKRALRESRLLSTQRLVAALGAENEVFLCASAISAYPGDGSPCREQSFAAAGPGASFIHTMTRDWEAAALQAPAGVRTVLLRIGVVLGDTGMLDGLLPLFRARLARHLGDPQLPLPWIDVRDVVRMLVFLAQHPEASGPYNVVSPTPVPFEAFSRAVGREIGSQPWIGLPAWVVRLVLGRDASELVLARYDALPERALALGFRFAHPNLDESLRTALAARISTGL